jgi:alkaline phosphatase D
MKIVAASCINIRDVNPQPAWKEIRAEQPDVVLLMGDNVYLQNDHHSRPDELAADLSARYAEQFAEPGFAGLMADLRMRGGQLIAIYDDHDFIGNNRYAGESDAALGQAARAEFIKAFSPVMTGLDVYRVHHFGDVDLIILDERFYRASPTTSGADRDAILGEVQWQWFEKIVTSSQAKYLVIASSTTLHAFGDQSWEQYPAAFKRMVSLLRDRAGALVVSGDVHRNAAYDESGVIEIVTSGLAQRSIAFGTIRKNYGVLAFDETALHVDLRSLKIGSRFDFTIPLSNWCLP